MKPKTNAEYNKIKALLWLVAAAQKYGRVRSEAYYGYAEGELGLSRMAALQLVNRLEELGLLRRETMRLFDLTPLVKYIEELERRV